MGITASHARPHPHLHPHSHPHAIQPPTLKSLPLTKRSHTPSTLTKYSISYNYTTTPCFHEDENEMDDTKIDIIDGKDESISTIPRCCRVLSCGHRCAGVSGETIQECFCFNEICVTKQQKIRQHASDNCGICLTSLSDDTCMALTCGHIFHASCIRDMLTSSSPHTWMQPQMTSQYHPEISRITFTHATCAYCHDPTQLISHSTLTHIIHPIYELHTIISTIIHDRMKMDALHQDERVMDVNSEWYQRVDALGWHIYAIYQCHQCNLPYFGGQIACEAGMNIDEMHLKRICPSCHINDHPLIGMGCHDRTHESDWVYKCRFCCSEALWVCGGDVHCCDSCHNDFYNNLNGNAEGQVQKSKCPPEGKSHCPLNISTPHKNGPDPSCELVIRCTRCSFEPMGPLYTSPKQHIQTQTIVHSHNLIPTTSLDGWMNGEDAKLSIGTRIPSLKRKQQRASQQHVQSSWQLQLITGSRYIQPSHLDEWRWEIKQPIVEIIPDPVPVPVPVVKREIHRRDCMHECDMWSGHCCSCEDEREFAPLSGMIMGTELPRYQYYCPICKIREMIRWDATRRVVQREQRRQEEIQWRKEREQQQEQQQQQQQQQQHEIPQAPPSHPYNVREQVLKQIRARRISGYTPPSKQQFDNSSSQPPSSQLHFSHDELVLQLQHESSKYDAHVKTKHSPLPRWKIQKLFKITNLKYDEKHQQDGIEHIQWLDVASERVLAEMSVQEEEKQAQQVMDEKHSQQQDFKEEKHVKQGQCPHSIYVKQEQRPRSYSLPLSQPPLIHTRSHSHIDISSPPLEIDGIPIAPPLSPIKSQARIPFHIRPQPIPIAPPLPMPVMEEKQQQPEPEREHVRVRTLLPDTCTYQWQTDTGLKSYTIALRRSGEAFGQQHVRPSRAKRILNWFHHPKPGQKVNDIIIQQWMDYEISPVIEVSEYVRVSKIQADGAEDVNMPYLLRVDLLDVKKRLIHTREMRQIIHAHDEWDRIRLVCMFVPRGVRYIRITHGVDPTSASPSIGAHLQLTGTSVKLHTMASGDRLSSIAVVVPDQPPPFRPFGRRPYGL